VNCIEHAWDIDSNGANKTWLNYMFADPPAFKIYEREREIDENLRDGDYHVS
jgi:hypothetical protein